MYPFISTDTRDFHLVKSQDFWPKSKSSLKSQMTQINILQKYQDVWPKEHCSAVCHGVKCMVYSIIYYLYITAVKCVNML